MREREVGLAAVRAAARLCEVVRTTMVGGGGPDALDKDDRSPVTVADFGAQALVCRAVRQAFPDDPILAEEDSAALRRTANAAALGRVVELVGAEAAGATVDGVCAWIDLGQGQPSGRYWALDPIDGTKGFLRNDQYAVALALIEDGRVEWGFLACPALPLTRPPTPNSAPLPPNPGGSEDPPGLGGRGAIFAARRGGGTALYSLDGAPLGFARVSDEAEPARARLAESVEAAHTNRGLAAELCEALGIRAEPVRMDSQAKYAVLARGGAEIYLRSPNPRSPDYRENIWDHAAGWLVVTEAGGSVSDVYGRPLDWTAGRRLERNIGVVATNGRLHGTVLATLAKLLP